MPYDAQKHGPRRVVGPGFHERVRAVVARIPRGFVATYGDVAQALGLRSAARQVGFALAALPAESEVPWHRVVNRLGQLRSSDPAHQARLLRAEGIALKCGAVRDFARVRVPVAGLV